MFRGMAELTEGDHGIEEKSHRMAQDAVLALAVIVVVGVPGSKPVKAECQPYVYTYSSIWNACFSGGTGGCECVDVYP